MVWIAKSQFGKAIADQAAAWKCKMISHVKALSREGRDNNEQEPSNDWAASILDLAQKLLYRMISGILEILPTPRGLLRGTIRSHFSPQDQQSYATD